MQFLQNISLKPYHTFGMDVLAEYFVDIHNDDEAKLALEFAKNKKIKALVLGGGSNVLFTKDFNGLIVHNKIGGIEKLAEDDDTITLKVGGGEIWHSFVQYCLDKNYAGIENLALIPGSVGASPMQNIGAYGVEIKAVFHHLTAIHKETMEEIRFSKDECAFGYRESVFKNKHKDEFFIKDVSYTLQKKPVFHIEYGAIRQQLEKNGIEQLSIQAIANAVMQIRSSKLPDPAKIGNAGSFFKNPIVSKDEYLSLQMNYPGIVGYEHDDGTMKLAAGWLIEKAGFKGYRMGDAGVHADQSLVLVNYGNANYADMQKLYTLVQDTVHEKFGIHLSTEVNII